MSLLQPVTADREYHSHNVQHAVQLYGADEGCLAVRVGNYLAEGLRRGEGVLVLAASHHCAAFLRQLRLEGLDPDRAQHTGQLMVLDAEQTLCALMVGSEPDAGRFRQVVGTAAQELRPAIAGASKRAYGELVGLLWERGEIAAAVRLEEMWNEFLPVAGLQLFCGYPIDVFGAEFHSVDVEQVLRAHTQVISSGHDGDLGRAVQRAMGELGVSSPEAASCDGNGSLPGVLIPDAEQSILRLREQASEQADKVLTRARQYYEAEKRFRVLIENSSDAILVTAPEGEIRYASPSNVRLIGCAPEELAGHSSLELVHPEDRQEAIRQIGEALANPRIPVRMEARLRGTEGWRWVEVMLTDLSGEPAVAGIVWNYRDITERKCAEQSLRESERRLAARERYLQTLLDSLPECVKVLGPNGEVLEMNAAGLRMLEADSANQVIGKCVYPVIDESSRAAFQSLNESVFHGGAGGSLEFSIHGFKGAHRTFETHVASLCDDTDRVIGALSATRDITERKAAEEALRHANEGLEQFAYAAAHDLQEPIRTVALFTELLARRYRDKLDDTAAEFMKITVEGARRMQTLVQDLLAFTRSLDKPQDESACANANEVVKEVLANLRTAIDTAGATIVCAALPELPVYHAHLVQLLQNLITNALKYRSERPPRIEISAADGSDEYVVAVRDNGIGIPEDQRERIFGIFKRLHGRAIPGNGIGLAICHRIVLHYRGRIWVDSQEGEGCTFSFSLPRRQTEPRA